MLKLARFLSGFKKEVIVGPIFKLIEAIFELIVPIVTARVIDQGVKTGDVGYVWRMGGVMLLLGVVGLCCALICQKLASIASQGVGTALRNEMFSRINSFSHAEIDRFGTPSLITRITNDVNQLQYAVAMLIRLVIRAPFLALGAVVMAMLIDFQLAVVFLVATPLIALVLYLIMSKSVPYFRVMQKKLDKISLISREGLSGVRVIRAFSKQDSEMERFREASDDQTATAIRVGKLSALLNPLTFAIVNFAIIAIVWFGGYRVESGGMTQGEVIAFVNYMTQTLLALIVVANLVVTFTKASASAARVNEVLDTVPTVKEGGSAGPRTVSASTPRISFEQMSFSYDGSDKYALRDLNLSIAGGETIGIIGGTGSGKSTLVNLIPRFYDATKGTVFLDGMDVRDYEFGSLRGKIGMVPQQAVLFTGTIRSNMKWRGEATDEQIWKALELAQAAEFVQKLTQGLDTPVNQGGKNFSGGQRQRLTIARALVSSPEILILDDSASALDFATDAALRKALKTGTENMTVLMVSQRASTVRRADRIIVLDDGEAVGVGTHEQLMESCQVYQEICLSQLSKEEAGGKA